MAIKKLLIIILLMVPALAFAAPCVPGQTPTELCNPVPTNDLPGMMGIILNFFGMIIGGVAITMIVFSGLRMIISQGDSEGITKAKESLTWTIAGFVLAILAFVIISGVQNFIGAREVPGSAVNSPSSIFNPVESKDLGQLVGVMLKNFFGIAGILAVLMLIIAGFRYITSAGNDEQAEQGKQGITWAIAGIVVILFAYVIISAVANFFNR